MGLEDRFKVQLLKTKIGLHPEDAHLCTICNRDVLYGYGRREYEDFAYYFWSYPYLKRGGRRQDAQHDLQSCLSAPLEAQAVRLSKFCNFEGTDLLALIANCR